MKEKRAQVKLHLLLESSEQFDVVQERIEQTLNCKFTWQKYHFENHKIVRCFGLAIVLDSYTTSGGTVYTLWGELDHTLMSSKHSPYNNLDDYEWLEIVDLSYVFITVFQTLIGDIWRVPTEHDIQIEKLKGKYQ